MADDSEHTYAERMFPAPVDHGIARPDRAVSSVPAGTSSYLEGAGGAGKAWYEGGGGLGDHSGAGDLHGQLLTLVERHVMKRTVEEELGGLLG